MRKQLIYLPLGLLFLITTTACNNAPTEAENTGLQAKEEPEKIPAFPVFSSYKEAIEAMRIHKDESMVSHGTIEQDKIKDFKGLKYFAPDSSYIFRAKFELLKPEKLVFKTTDERAPEYYKFCKISFSRNGTDLSLFGYVENPNAPVSIFVPFKDATSNKECYGGGRYIDLDYKGEKTMILLDFNYAYNPYCHYNHTYSCPLVPLENLLTIPIMAGEKKLYE